jgi:DNA-binding beta-propeller fold protein YncE
MSMTRVWLAAAGLLFHTMLLAQAPGPPAGGRTDEAGTAAVLRPLVARAPRVPLEAVDLPMIPPTPGWATGMGSWVSSDADGRIYLLQRGDQADPVIVLDRTGTVLRSWGKGRYVMPHGIRVDPQGHVWTTDAASSKVIEYDPRGSVLHEIIVGGQPTPCRNNFCSTTDVAFLPDGHVLIADGYANARVLEYTREGRKVAEWGSAGTGPGQFRLPHSIAVDAQGVVYVADRENGRVQRFTRQGKYLGEWNQYGKTFGVTVDAAGKVWLATQPRDLPNLSPGWLLQIDPATGALLAQAEVTGVHGMDVMRSGELLVGPGPEAKRPQFFRKPGR